MPTEKRTTLHIGNEHPDHSSRKGSLPDNMEMTEVFCSVRQVEFTITDLHSYLHHLRDLSARFGSHIICFNAEMVSGKAHVSMALSHAYRAEKKGTRISGSIEIEALLYAAGSRQIIDGAKFGLHEGMNRAYLCLCPEHAELSGILSDEMKIT